MKLLIEMIYMNLNRNMISNRCNNGVYECKLEYKNRIDMLEHELKINGITDAICGER
jgi:hypothetical protein